MKINFPKSKLSGVAVENSFIVRFASLLNCRQMEISFIYLGLPVGGNPRRLETWDIVGNKLQRRLAGWKSKQLSFGGCL